MSNYNSYGSPTRPDPNCRTCTDFKTWSKQQRELDQASSKVKKSVQFSQPVAQQHDIARDCPLDKDGLGQYTWGLLHTMAAVFPNVPSESQRRDMITFYDALSRLYPCEHCAKDFQKDLRQNPINVSSQKDFSLWLCNFHNRVNRKLGKPQFDCSKVNERWRDGYADGSCD